MLHIYEEISCFLSCEKVVIIYDSRTHPPKVIQVQIPERKNFLLLQNSFQMKNEQQQHHKWANSSRRFPDLYLHFKWNHFIHNSLCFTCSIILQCLSKKEAIFSWFHLSIDNFFVWFYRELKKNRLTQQQKRWGIMIMIGVTNGGDMCT